MVVLVPVVPVPWVGSQAGVTVGRSSTGHVPTNGGQSSDPTPLASNADSTLSILLVGLGDTPAAVVQLLHTDTNRDAMGPLCWGTTTEVDISNER